MPGKVLPKSVMLLFIFCSSQLYAQQVIDSLMSALNQSVNAHQRVEILNELSLQLIGVDPEKSLSNATKAIRLAKSSEDKHGEAISYIRIGSYYDVKSHYDTALQLFNKAQELGSKKSDYLVLAQTYIFKGVVNRHMSNYQIALEHLQEGLIMSQNIENPYWEAYAYNVMGLVYQQKGDLDSSLFYSQKALAIRQKLGSKIDIASSLGNIGLVYDFKGAYEKALDYYSQSLELNIEIENLSGAAINWNNIGIVYGLKGDLDQSIDAYEKAFKLHEQVGNKRYMAGTLDNIGQNYYDKGLFVKALEVYQRTLDIREEIGDTNGKATSLMNIGDMYRLQKRPLAALPNYQEALKLRIETEDKFGEADALHNLGKLYVELYKEDSARLFFNQSLALREVIGDPVGMANTHNSIARLELQNDHIEVAISHYAQALDIAREVGNNPVIVTSLKGLSYAYYQREEYDKALDFANEAMEVLSASKHILAIQDLHLLLAKIHSALGNYQTAYDHQVTFANIRDSLLNNTTAEQLTKMQVSYDTERKEQMISDQKYEISILAAANAYRQRIIWIGGASLILLFGLIMAYRSRRFAIKEKHIHEHYAQMLLTSHEEERKRISRDLHDSVGQSLMLIKNKILLDSREETVSMVSQALEEVRSISKALHPALLEEMGLTASIQKLVAEYDEATEVFFTSEIENIDNLFDKEKELHIFRIVQESINNLIKHAETPSANIQIQSLEEKVVIHIRDFGVGFDLTGTSFTNSLGMKTLKERTQILNGKIVIHSEKDKGTSIVLELPK